MFGTLTSAETEKVLEGQIIGRIGCYADNVCYIVPICYAYDGIFIYAHTQEGKKIDMMRANPSVCFEVDIIHDMANWQSVIGWGNFSEIMDAEGKKLAIQQIYKRKFPVAVSNTVKLDAAWPFLPEKYEGIYGIFFRIHLQKKTGRFEK